MNKSESKYFHTALRMDEALITLLEKKDLEFITVKEICETAGVNRSTFYLHYSLIIWCPAGYQLSVSCPESSLMLTAPDSGQRL
ncbi:MAG: TetR/AcrR family transcriptional regulator [Candidatus Limiplasma sp.]|nr:TetR/AcrR family transcriptional regulator [Candidatus Limiplasma sp.]